jgi:(-)-germacrene D synthase
MIRINYVYRLWKDLNLVGKLPFIRDRVVECYFWILGEYFKPEYLLGRRMLTKVIALISIIDDIYNVYGTLEELELFTETTERLKLPHLMKIHNLLSLIYYSRCYINSNMKLIHQVYLLYRWDTGATYQLNS